MIIDAGPLVALAAEPEPNHQRCVEVSLKETSSLLTTWPVVTEAAWVGRRWPKFTHLLAELFARGAIEIYPLPADALPWIFSYMRRYESIRADLADASLMYVAEHEKIESIFTLDRRDFSIYRTSKNRALKIVP
jgi:hypothetical protein